MNIYIIAFTVCDKPIFYIESSVNTPDSRALFISRIAEHHKKLIAECESDLSKSFDEHEIEKLNMLIGRYKARQYFVDKFEQVFLDHGKTPMSPLSAYDIKVIKKIPA